MDSIDEVLADKKAELDKLRPLSRPGLAQLASWYDVELTYTSNAIEGGITVSGKPLRDHMEAVGHLDALRYVRELAAREQPVREADVRQIHRLVLGRSDPENAGRYADAQRLISGTSYRPPPPSEVRPLMGDFGQWLAVAPATAETAIAAHERIATIHPFSDGNGRTARLLMNLVLLKGGFPPVVIGPEHRLAYVEGLDALNVGGDVGPYRRFMVERLEASLVFYLEALREAGKGG
jgi:Fic family protein